LTSHFKVIAQMWLALLYLDYRLYGYYFSSMLYHQEKNLRTKHVKQLGKIKFISIQQRYQIKTTDMLSKYVGEERTYTMFITGDGK